ncbi:MAG: hypothetical protein HY353_03715 [Candidatus Omnitrophica bacterium]|nr:hypothetical protein [Candidatus Omnitrophota bacterium]
MAFVNYQFEKRRRDLERKQKQEAKRLRKLERKKQQAQAPEPPVQPPSV